ncbi:MAG: TIGR01777 family protein [Acidobacteria bacterium]|nr:TIGR01777 family protein [Acidobacteriota bacterium]
MKIVITGSSGLIGTALIASLNETGHRVTRLVRSQPRAQAGEAHWDPAAGELDATALEGQDAIVNLAGETIAERWTAANKARIRDSRIQGTRLLCDAMARLKQRPSTGSGLRPAVLVNASAIGYYGDRGAERLTEDSSPGTGFLADVCRQWEAATAAAAKAGVRVVCLRTGVVLSARGGALAKMLPPFRLGLGGRIGSGKQFMSWIALDDLVGIIRHALATPTLTGPVNAVAPNPVTNQEFTRTLGKVLGRPTLFPVPAFAMRLAFGEMAEELLLGSARVEPQRITASGYSFRYPELEAAFRHVLYRKKTKVRS